MRRAGGYAWRWLRHGASAGNQKSSSAPGSPAPARGAGEWAGSDVCHHTDRQLHAPVATAGTAAVQRSAVQRHARGGAGGAPVAAVSSAVGPRPNPEVKGWRGSLLPRNEKKNAPSQPLTDAPFMYRYRILYGSWTGNHNLSTAPGAAHGPLPSRHSRARLNNRKYRILTRETA